MSKHDDPYCPRSRLSWRLLALQAALLLALVAVVVGALCASGFALAERDEDRVIDIVQGALGRNADGGLTLRSTPDLKQLRAETPDLWFLVRDRQGHSLVEGTVPAEFAAIGRELLESEMPLPRPIRLMGLTLSSLEGVEKGSRREKAARSAQLSLL